MKVVACPKCKTKIGVPDGTKPYCPSCGFGDQPVAAKPEAPPIPAAPEKPKATKAGAPPAAKAAPNPKSKRGSGAGSAPALQLENPYDDLPAGKGIVGIGLWLPLLLAALLIGGLATGAWYTGLLGGDSGEAEIPAAPLYTSDQARSRAEAAITQLAGAQGTNLPFSAMHLEMTFEESDAEDDILSLGAGTMSVDLQVGANAELVALFSISTSGITIEMGVYCNAETVIVSYGGEAYESRPGTGDESCLGEGDESTAALTDSIDQGLLTELANSEDIHGLRATSEPDGSIAASFSDSEGVAYTMYIDPSGRPGELTGSSPEGTFLATFEYGTGTAIEFPTPSARVPSAVSCWGFTLDGTWSADCTGGGDPLSDFEVRVLNATTNATVATFPLDTGDRTVDGYELIFTDDGDGLLGGNDTITVRGLADENIVIWDKWAGRSIDDHPAPGVWALLPLLAAVALIRRRH